MRFDAVLRRAPTILSLIGLLLSVAASRNLAMICSGLCRFRFMQSLLAQFLGIRDSHRDWINFRGAGHSAFE